jgi:cytochrome c-type biogenesis protein
VNVNSSLGLFVAFGAGLLSFISPCTLPLLPGYLAYMSGLSADEVKARENVQTVVTAALLFVVGLALVFVALGATASYIGHAVSSHLSELTRAAGAFIVFMALVMLGMFRIPMLAMDRRFHPASWGSGSLRRELGMWGALPLGMAFGFGWSPCIGPILGSILAIAAKDSQVQRGSLLLFVYALGLGLPFLLAALFTERVFGSLAWFKRHYLTINRTGGAVLLAMGVFLLLGQWTQLLSPVMNWYAQLNLPT